MQYVIICGSQKIPPAIYGFDDRVEIISYGLLKDGMTKDEFFNGISKPVNEEFAKIFMQLGYMEQSGKGVPTIVSKYGKDAYRFGSSFIQCILPYNILDKVKQDALLGKNATKNATKLTKTENNIVEIMRDNSDISLSEIAKRLGKDVSTIKRATKVLKDRGIVRRIGTTRVGHWEVVV